MTLSISQFPSRHKKLASVLFHGVICNYFVLSPSSPCSQRLAPISVPPNSVSFRFSRPNLQHRIPLSIRSVQVPAAPTPEGLAPAISLTDNELKHLNKMRSECNQDLCLRIGIKQGGCSGMSYTIDFEDRANARANDSIIEYNGFVVGMIYILVLVV